MLAPTPRIQDRPKEGRRLYEVPVLTQFGTVRELTQGGSAGPSETPGNCQSTKSAPCPP